jgi:hypothetical protein
MRKLSIEEVQQVSGGVENTCGGTFLRWAWYVATGCIVCDTGGQVCF